MMGITSSWVIGREFNIIDFPGFCESSEMNDNILSLIRHHMDKIDIILYVIDNTTTFTRADEIEPFWKMKSIVDEYASRGIFKELLVVANKYDGNNPDYEKIIHRISFEAGAFRISATSLLTQYLGMRDTFPDHIPGTKECADLGYADQNGLIQYLNTVDIRKERYGCSLIVLLSGYKDPDTLSSVLNVCYDYDPSFGKNQIYSEWLLRTLAMRDISYSSKYEDIVRCVAGKEGMDSVLRESARNPTQILLVEYFIYINRRPVYLKRILDVLANTDDICRYCPETVLRTVDPTEYTCPICVGGNPSEIEKPRMCKHHLIPSITHVKSGICRLCGKRGSYVRTFKTQGIHGMFLPICPGHKSLCEITESSGGQCYICKSSREPICTAYARTVCMNCFRELSCISVVEVTGILRQMRSDPILNRLCNAIDTLSENRYHLFTQHIMNPGCFKNTFKIYPGLYARFLEFIHECILFDNGTELSPIGLELFRGSQTKIPGYRHYWK